MRGMCFEFHGKGLLGFIRAKGWMSLFPHSGSIVRILGEELADFDAEGRHTNAVVREIVRLRREQIESKLKHLSSALPVAAVG
jgi:hypothetical protein